MASTPRHQGRLELTWTDKDKTLLSTGDGKYDYTFVDPSDYRVSEVRLLHEVDRVGAPTPETLPAALAQPTNDNLLITGDAMHVLDALDKVLYNYRRKSARKSPFGSGRFASPAHATDEPGETVAVAAATEREIA